MTDYPRLGRQHPTLKRLRALRRDGQLRRTESSLVAEGPRLAAEALTCGLPIEIAVVTARLSDDPQGRELAAELAEAGTPIFEVDDSVMHGLQDARSARAIVCVVRRPDWTANDLFKRPAPLIVVADGLQDPGNLGGLIRTADAAGAAGCVSCGDGADPFHPRAVRAGAGSAFRLPLLESSHEELFSFVERAGLRCAGSFPGGGTDHRRSDLTGPLALFFGREGSGLSAEVAARIDQRLAIPMREGVESLSVGAAAAILLFEAASQRGEAISARRDRGG